MTYPRDPTLRPDGYAKLSAAERAAIDDEIFGPCRDARYARPALDLRGPLNDADESFRLERLAQDRARRAAIRAGTYTRKSKRNGRPVTDGTTTYDSADDAAEAMGVTRSAIYNWMARGNAPDGRHWRYGVAEEAA